MVTVAPAEGSDVKISLLRAGESRLQVNADGVSRDLTVRATREGDALSIEISQVPAAASTPAPQAEAKLLPSEKERGSYALGIEFGRRLRQQSMELDAELVSRGLSDALAGGSTLLTEGELKAAMLAIQSRLRDTQQREQSELAERNRKEGEAFLIENKSKEGVVTLESGLQYKVLKAGDGAKPASEDTVVCHYRGTFLDGTEFDSSAKRQKAGSFPLRSVIRGWKEALQLMPVGSKWQLFVPPNLAYGERGSKSRIGPNKTLVFEVELLSIEEGPRSAGKTAAPAASQNDTPSDTTVK
jgi:FKBP-type peptidyl-prolyl cis-trans isomerase